MQNTNRLNKTSSSHFVHLPASHETCTNCGNAIEPCSVGNSVCVVVLVLVIISVIISEVCLTERRRREKEREKKHIHSTDDEDNINDNAADNEKRLRYRNPVGNFFIFPVWKLFRRKTHWLCTTYVGCTIGEGLKKLFGVLWMDCL